MDQIPSGSYLCLFGRTVGGGVYAVGGVHGGGVTFTGGGTVVVVVAVAVAVGGETLGTGAGSRVGGAGETSAGVVVPAVAVSAGAVVGGVTDAVEPVGSGTGGAGRVAALEGERAISHQTSRAIPKSNGPARSATIRPRLGRETGRGSSREETKGGAGVGGGATGMGRTTGGAGAAVKAAATGAAWSAAAMSVEIRAAAGTSNATMGVGGAMKGRGGGGGSDGGTTTGVPSPLAGWESDAGGATPASVGWRGRRFGNAGGFGATRASGGGA